MAKEKAAVATKPEEEEDLLASLEITAPPGEEEQPTTDDALKALQTQLDEANKKSAEQEKLLKEAEDRAVSAANARAKLEGERNKANDEATTSYQGQIAAQETAIDTALNAATSEVMAAKADYKRARENGLVDEETAASERIASAAYDVKAFTAQKQQFSAWKSQEEERLKAVKAQPQSVGPDTQRWIDAHPRYNNDVEYNEHTNALHRAAIRLGKRHESPEYFKYIENGLEKIYAESPVERKGQEETPANSTATPTSRESAPSGGAPPGKAKVKFTANEMDIIRLRAEEDNITIEKAAGNYQKNREKLQEKGIIGRAN